MKSFTFRLTLQFAGLVTAATAVVLVAGGFLLEQQHERSLEILHEIESHELVELIGTDPAAAANIAERIKHDADSDAALFVIQVSNARGEVLFRSDNLGETVLTPRASGDPHLTVTLPFLGRVHLTEVVRGPWRIQIGSPLAPAERLLRDYIRVSLLLLLGASLLGLGLGYAFSRATLRPLQAIESTARRIGADNLTARIPVPPGHDELASLTRLLNQMFDRLQTSFEQIGRFTADVSHELKTPLALIRLNAEKLRARAHADPECHAATCDILEEIDRLQHMIERLLFLAKTETGALATTFREVSLAPLIATFATDAEVLAEDRGARFLLQTNEPGSIRAEPELLRQLLLNLVANALAASPPGGCVTLQSASTASGWRFSVQDEGPGLAPEQIARAFDRFARFAPSGAAVATARGHGLGLAICRSIVDMHGGSIRLENRADRSGLVVTIDLPGARTAPAA